MTLPTWRSLLYVPANAERFVARAHTRGADAIILDLEDSVPPDAKPAARSGLATAVAAVGQGGADVLVRVNRPLELAVPDIAAAVGPAVAGLLLPKIMGPDHVRLLAELITAREAETGLPPGHTRLLLIVETAAALPLMEATCRADPRVVGLSVGGEDLATDLGAEPSADLLLLPKMLGVLAARAAGVLPMGFVGTVAGLSDGDDYRAALRRSRALGFACCSCVHPAQVPVINEEYGVRPEAADHARRLLAAYAAAAATGRGSVTFEGAMIDQPMVDRARALLARVR